MVKSGGGNDGRGRFGGKENGTTNFTGAFPRVIKIKTMGWISMSLVLLRILFSIKVVKRTFKGYGGILLTLFHSESIADFIFYG